MHRRRLRVPLLAVVLAAFATAGPATAQRAFTGGWKPDYPSTPLAQPGKGAYRVTIADNTANPRQHRLEQIAIVLRTAAGEPVNGARIAVDARTREVERRMQTAPRVTRSLGNGAYLVEGLHFNMAGLWLLEFDITAGKTRDKALLQVAVD